MPSNDNHLSTVARNEERPFHPSARYVIVSPVRDEGRFVDRTLESILRQTIRPVRWVIVDDGSLDNTPDILRRYSDKASWIHVIRRDRNGGREQGSGVIAAFNVGYQSLADLEYEYIVKLDCDVALPPDYFEALFTRFDADPRLGIASGVYMEEKNGVWRPIQMPAYHASGASKVVRRSCFREIGGFVVMRGWDTADEIKARAMNWRTAHFKDIRFRHLKPEGSADGWFSTQLLHGEEYYRYGGSKVFFILKLAQRAVSAWPPVIAALVMLWGYVKACALCTPKLVTQAEERSYRKLQYSRLLRATTDRPSSNRDSAVSR